MNPCGVLWTVGVTAGLVLGLCAAPPTAAQDEAADPAPVMSERSADEIEAAAPDGWPRAADPSPATRRQAPDWHGPGAVRLRWGVEWHPATAGAAQPFVGVGLAAGRRTTLFYEQARQDLPSGLPWQAVPDPDARVGFEFRTRSPRAAWRDFGTLRMQVGLNSRLTVKPRRGGAKLTWQTRF